MIAGMAARGRRGGGGGAGPGLPLELRRLWGLWRPAARGRPPSLDLERVVRAAVALADRSGLEGVTLPRIGKVLGYSAMSLYRYVGSKDALLSLMGDVGAGAPPEITSSPAAWREGLRRWAAAAREVNHRRPWLARLPLSGPPAGPNQVAWMEAGLRVLRGTGLRSAEKLGLLMLIGGYVRQMSLLSQDLAHGRKGSGLDQVQAERLYGRSLSRLVDPDRFPETARVLASGVFGAPARPPRDDPAADPDFTFGLERILDGAAVAVARRTRRSPT